GQTAVDRSMVVGRKVTRAAGMPLQATTLLRPSHHADSGAGIDELREQRDDVDAHRAYSGSLDLEICIPIDRYPARYEVHRLYVVIQHERQQSFAFAIAYHHDIVGAGGQQVGYLAEHDSFERGDFESFEVRPVVLSVLRVRQRRTPDHDFATHQGRCAIPI